MTPKPQTSCSLHTITGQDATYEFYDEQSARHWCQKQWGALPREMPRPAPHVVQADAWTPKQFQQLSNGARNEKDDPSWHCGPRAVSRFHFATMRAAINKLRDHPSSTHFEWLKRMGFAAQSSEVAKMLMTEVIQHPDTYAMTLYHQGGHLSWLMDHHPTSHEFFQNHRPKSYTSAQGYWPSLWVRSLLDMTLSYDDLMHSVHCTLTPSKSGLATHGCLALEGHLPAQIWCCYRARYQYEPFVTAWSSLPLVRDYHRVLHGNVELECPHDPRLFLLNEASHQRLSSAQFYAEVLRIAQKPVPLQIPLILPLPSVG